MTTTHRNRPGDRPSWKVTNPDGPHFRVSMDWIDLLKEYETVVRPEYDGTMRRFQDQLAFVGTAGRYEKSIKSFHGAMTEDVLSWARDGFFAPEFANSADYVPLADKLRPVWSDDDGEPDAGKIVAGDDDIFLAMEERPGRTGITVIVDYNFAWIVSTDEIQGFGAWCAGFISRLEADGYDLEVMVNFPVKNMGYDSGTYTRMNTGDIHVKVKEFGMQSDFTGWSVLFSPGGYRHLGFTAYGIANDLIGADDMTGGISRCPETSYGVQYDRELSLVTITSGMRGTRGGKFDSEMMQGMAIRAGILPAK